MWSRALQANGKKDPEEAVEQGGNEKIVPRKNLLSNLYAYVS